MNFRKNVILKKAWRYGSSVPRVWQLAVVREEFYAERPPLLVNSVPKSGTHLLQQIVSVLPGVRDWGNFWASQPSYTFRERSGERMASRIRKVVPGELVCGHLHYSEEAKAALEKKNVVHLFIYRDPRDVVVSEAHYLAEMNRWHRMHSRFKSLPERERLMLSIYGSVDAAEQYPNVLKRFQKFEGWIGDPGVFAVSYESLISEGREEVFRRLFEFIGQRREAALDCERLVARAIEAVQPKRSHTFRRGGSGGWRRDFDDRIKSAFKEVTGDLVLRLGYERSADW